MKEIISERENSDRISWYLNVDKTTFINAIAGTRLRVGNGPGVTVEKRSRVEIYLSKF